jgi:hypothetical protein
MSYAIRSIDSMLLSFIAATNSTSCTAVNCAHISYHYPGQLLLGLVGLEQAARHLLTPCAHIMFLYAPV